MTGTYILRDKDLQDTEATISLYIRISSLGKSVVTEITSVEGAYGLFCVRGEMDEEDPYLTQKLKARRLRRGSCPDLPPIPIYRREDMVCNCERFKAKKIKDMDISEILALPSIFVPGYGYVNAVTGVDDKNLRDAVQREGSRKEGEYRKGVFKDDVYKDGILREGDEGFDVDEEEVFVEKLKERKIREMELEEAALREAEREEERLRRERLKDPVIKDECNFTINLNILNF